MIPILQKCYLKKQGDEQNKIEITHAHLIITLKGNINQYHYDQISSINVTPKKLIIPLILGGIGASLSMLALSIGWYNYQINLMCVFIFFGWSYYGFIGRDAIVIQEKDNQSIFLIQSHPDIIKEFVNQFNERKWKISRLKPELIYHVVEIEQWQNQSTSYEYAPESMISEGFIHASTQEQLEESIQLYTDPVKKYIVLAIHSPWLLSPLKWEYSNRRQSSFPHIYGKINKSAIIKATILQSEAFEDKLS